MKNNKGFTLLELLITLGAVVVAPACLYGWIHNIYIIANSSFTPIAGKLIIRVIGIFLVPLGVVMGYLS